MEPVTNEIKPIKTRTRSSNIGLNNTENNLTNNKNNNNNLVESVNHDLREFTREFVSKRESLGLNPKDIVSTFHKEFKDYSLTESSLIKFEKLDLSPSSISKMRRSLEKWLKFHKENEEK
jgi:hypothetical protein